MLFTPQLARKPNLYPWADEFSDRLEAGFWTPRRFTFKSDMKQFHSDALTDHERQVMVRTLSAIGQIEIAVKTWWGRMGDTLQHPAIQDLGYVLAHTEVIHNKAYEKFLNVGGFTKAFEDNLKVPVVGARVAYLRKYANRVYEDDHKQFIYAMILFTLFVENVSLFSQFYTILHFNRFKNIMKDTAQQVTYTKNEELIHAAVGIKIINTLRQEYPHYFDAELEARIIEASKVALVAEQNIVAWMLDGHEAPGLSAPILDNFLAQRMNESLTAIGYPAIFEVQSDASTAWFREELYGTNVGDFFHVENVNYGRDNKSYDEEDLF